MKILLIVALAGLAHAGQGLYLPNRYAALPYAGYRMERIRDAVTGRWSLRLSAPRGGSMEFTAGGDSAPKDAGYVSLGLRNLLGGPSRQMVGLVRTGGAHCCHYYWIVDAGDSARVLFDSRDYDRYEPREMESVEDLDGDGALELIFRHAQPGWHPSATINRPAPVQIFRFDRTSYRYLPANNELIYRATRELPALLQTIRRGPDPNGAAPAEEQRGHVLEAALILVYTEHWAEAKSLFRRYYKPAEWKEFEQDVIADPFYRLQLVRRRK